MENKSENTSENDPNDHELASEFAGLASLLSTFSSQLAAMADVVSKSPRVVDVRDLLQESLFPSVQELAAFARGLPMQLAADTAQQLEQALTDGRELGLAICAIPFEASEDPTELAGLRDLAKRCEATATAALNLLEASPLGAQTVQDGSLRQGEESLLAFLERLNRERPVRVTVVRASPTVWRGEDIAGTLETFDQPISVAEIRDQFGGGKYKLRILSRPHGGSYRYTAHRTVTIAGDPILDERIAADAIEKRCSLAREALGVAQASLESARQRVGDEEGVRHVWSALREEIEHLLRKRRDQLEMAATKFDSSGSIEVAAIERAIERDVELLAMHERHLADLDQLLASADAHSKRQTDLHRSAFRHLESAYEARIRALELARTVFGEPASPRDLPDGATDVTR